MKLRNWFLRQIAERGLIEYKHDYYTDKDKRAYDDLQEEYRQAAAGEERKPLWGNSGGELYLPSWSGVWKHGGDDQRIWYLFWDNINDQQKREYLVKHQAPPEDWYQKLIIERTLGTKEKWKWLNEQKERVKNGAQLEPPWITFPISLSDVGWDDYFLESWKLNVWIPFWDKLNEEERTLYLAKFPPPDKEWKDNITIRWTGKIRKTAEWFARQRFFLENQTDHFDCVLRILFPWEAFPTITAKETTWDAEFTNKWLAEIWLPFWNSMNNEEQDEILVFQNLPENEWLEILARYEVKNFHKLKELKSNETKG